MRKRMAWLVSGVLAAGLAGTAVHAGLEDAAGKLGAQKPAEESKSGSSLGERALRQLAETGAPMVNSALNSAAGSHQVKDGATKVVPILTVGQGKAIGLAQVAGPAKAVQGVQAVVSVEVALLANRLRGRVLVPVDTRDLSKSYKRIGEVGVSAVLDYRL